jgi:hypothetical protein
VLLAQMLKDDPEYVPGWVMLSKLAPNNLQKAAFLEKILTLEPQHAYARQQMEALEAGAAGLPETEWADVELAEALEADLDVGRAAPVIPPPEVQTYDVAALPEEDVVEPAADALRTGLDAQEAIFEPPGVTEPASMPISEEPYDFDAQAAANTLPPWLAGDEELLAAEAGGDGPGEAERMPPEPELPDWLKVEEKVSGPVAAPAGGRVRVREGAVGERPAPASRPAPAVRTGPPAWLINALIIILTGSGCLPDAFRGAVRKNKKRWPVNEQATSFHEQA